MKQSPPVTHICRGSSSRIADGLREDCGHCNPPRGPIPPAERSAVGYADRAFYIPEHIARKIDGYLERGEMPGSFLQAVIQNNLSAAIGRADDENLANLPAIVTYFYNAAPAVSWGSAEKMTEWIARFAKPETGRRAPVQAERRRAPVKAGIAYDQPEKPAGTISWEEHLEAYVYYSRKYGNQQTAERLAERGGFGYWELVDLLGHPPKTWAALERDKKPLDRTRE